jgi:hypothetical protein
MSSTYSSSLRVELIGNGDQAGTWGTTTDNNFAYIFDTAIAGYQAVTVSSASQALTYVNGPTSTAALNQSVYAILKFNSAAAASSIYAPPASKQYIIWNNTSYTITIYNSTVIGNTTAAGTGVAIIAGAKVMVWSDGTNFYDLQSPTLTTTLPITAGGTGKTTNNTAFNALAPIQTATVSAGNFVVGQAYSIATLGTTTQAQWNIIAGTSGATYIVGSTFTAATAGLDSGTGTATAYTAAGSFITGLTYTILTLGSTTNTQWNTAAGTSGVTYIVGSTFTAASAGVGTGTATTSTSGRYLVSNGTNASWNPQYLSITYVIDLSASPTGVKGDITVPFSCAITEWTLLADQTGSIGVDIWKDTYANYPPTSADTLFTPITVGGFTVGLSYVIVNYAGTTNANWNSIAGTSGVTYAVGSVFTAAIAGTSLGSGTASPKPTIVSSTKGQSATLTGWTTTINAGDTLRFNVDSSSSVQRVTLSLKAYRT